MVFTYDSHRATTTGNLRGRARITFITSKRARGKTKTPNRHNHPSVSVKVVVIVARNTEKLIARFAKCVVLGHFQRYFVFFSAFQKCLLWCIMGLT